MSLATGSSEAAGGAGGGGARVFFQSPRGGAAGSPGSSSGAGSSREDSAPVAPAAGQVQQQQQQQQQRRHQQGKVTVKYDRKELRKRLVLEEWIVEQLGRLYGCEGLTPAALNPRENRTRSWDPGNPDFRAEGTERRGSGDLRGPLCS
ncbi:protein phosphatase 1 regulatory subunit 14C isoform X2 [Myotis myotis]|uniref:protein phosphatase 1 regulatory subunit 14C isoform X2 n=1 Tax=Myotis myotis TaxID=51298 RepID=UPI001749F31E|nr:protein phosphatase 1 regulatory subunit 14C isoform X2 [Myotis myotis]